MVGGRSRSLFAKLKVGVFHPTERSDAEVDLSLKQADDLYRWQLVQDNPRALEEQSFFQASIVGGRILSRDVYLALCRLGILDPKTGEMDTNRIDKNFSHGVSMLSLGRQRKLVGMLFHWEEEVTRLRLLDEEEAEIRRAMDLIGADDEDCQIGLDKVEMKRAMLPSERLRTSQEDAPPGYSAPFERRPSRTQVELPAEEPLGLPADVPDGMPAELPVGLPAEMPAEMPVGLSAGLPAEMPAEMPAELPVEMPVEPPIGAPVELVADQPAAWPSYGMIPFGYDYRQFDRRQDVTSGWGL